ncbi:MAG TPA: isoprenylcysteine carboxylmethyltransferase family protein [Chthoniobacterales bacterium]
MFTPLLPACLGGLYLLSEVFLSITRRSGTGAVSRDRRSLILLWLVITLSIWLSIRASYWPPGRLPRSLVWPWLGLFTFVLGIALRWYAILYLGRFFTVNVAIAQEHELIDSGPYRWIRHPSYTGALLALVGFGLSLGSWVALICLVIPTTAVFSWRIYVEERALSEALGDAYRQYMARTRRLIPFLY